MALYMKKITSAGFEVNFWIIQSIQVDRQEKTVNIQVVPYTSKTAFEAQCKGVLNEKVNVRVKDIIYPSSEYGESSAHYSEYFSPEALAKAGVDIYAVAYNYIKQHIPEFAEAKDI